MKVITALSFIGVLIGCSANRPRSVPNNAVYVAGAKTGWWQSCTYDSSRNADFCKVYGDKGGLIIDEEFIPFEGPAAKQEELTIDGSSRLASTGRIVLKNGRVLLRKSTYAGERQIVSNSLGR
jgi:hypothetical protein